MSKPLSTPVVIATRQSQLALWQAEHVAAQLRALYPGLQVDLLPMTTRGDQVLDQPLAAIGGKGLFLKELEVAMLEGRAHLAVHSLKDVPMQLEPEFELAAIMSRADAADAFVSNHYQNLAALPPAAVVGTSSLRRQLLLREQRPDLRLMDLRGNVNTRLAKLDSGAYHAIVLASAGLQRLGLGARIRSQLPLPAFVPAAGQASLAIEIRSGDLALKALLAPLHDPESAAYASAERSFTAALGGSCQMPIGAYAEPVADGGIRLHGLIGTADLTRHWRASIEGQREQAEALGRALADRIRALGASDWL